MNYPLLNVFFTTMWVFLWVMWFFLLFRVFGDLFRDDSVSGWGKAGWCVFVLVLPFLGVFVYLIARGKSMGRREMQRSQEAEAEFRSYVQDAAAGSSTTSQAGELSKLAELRQHGDITEDEYKRAKEHVLAA
ncbi:SHOCT domain-containing protein [Streptacidiphilus jiangxiensis]|uniref:Short C-terminal domain-containing protein n=1 Tax=Streptacidiphilus jiangxiensis TaxID=235985 RepID=A0A1H7T8P3_STRJI|nr:SHOCT domain-containing protein [Streptacidiphilus jiangxiensis]SEL81113.1 Short C-terminal domain-containing protein [Streptacidiphilus jiangxiensis]